MSSTTYYGLLLRVALEMCTIHILSPSLSVFLMGVYSTCIWFISSCSRGVPRDRSIPHYPSAPPPLWHCRCQPRVPAANSGGPMPRVFNTLFNGYFSEIRADIILNTPFDGHLPRVQMITIEIMCQLRMVLHCRE